MTKQTSYIECCGSSAHEVTGSAYLIIHDEVNILVDYGLKQSSDEAADYQVNSKRHKSIKPKKLDLVLLTHCHADHASLVPKLYAEGSTAPIIVSKGSEMLLEIMWMDSVKIFEADFEKIGRKMLYTKDDVKRALSYVQEMEYGEAELFLKGKVKVRLFRAQHIVKASQILVEFTKDKKKIGFTGDISAYKSRYFLLERETLPPVDILVAECTYGQQSRNVKERDRKTDIGKLKTAVDKAIRESGKVVIPAFALNRLQDVLAMIYEAYDGNLPAPVYVDTPLGKAISYVWSDLIDKDYDLWGKILKNGDIRWISDYQESIKLMESRRPIIIIAGGGMLQGGRATSWCTETLSGSTNSIILSGYVTPQSTAGRLKDGKSKSIRIDHKRIQVRADIMSLNSFSSHCDHKHLLEYYTQAKYNRICLVHSEYSTKLQFAQDLTEELSRKNRTSRVICTNKGSRIRL